MIETIGSQKKIICDKCQNSNMADAKTCNEKWFVSGWILNSKAKKYFHVCPNCQSKEQRSNHSFIIKKFK